jgi:hypothetical protein
VNKKVRWTKKTETGKEAQREKSRGKKRKEKGKSYRGINNRGEIGD